MQTYVLQSEALVWWAISRQLRSEQATMSSHETPLTYDRREPYFIPSKVRIGTFEGTKVPQAKKREISWIVVYDGLDRGAIY